MGDVEIWVEGPMHPDLFGDETPIMIKMAGVLVCLMNEEKITPEEKECTLTQN